ncbi:hypothetical protein [Bacterioplanoides pacificum]|uniref:Uncharacterized protein n=1 Tax=Bacterioplanoides pacificum TaxID=1171596 RepID=A0ABV7VTA1_9GAMM
MKKSELFLGVRKTNGQIGYISEGLNIPEFFDLLRPVNNEINVLVDYSPVIEKLHGIHNKHNDEAILNSYNSLYNFWLDAKTYSKESLKISKSEELSKSSNSLINELQLRLQKKQRDFYSDRDAQLSLLNDIKSDGDIYIDTLLCFMHSKASLEIESFKKDMVISSYADFLHKLVQDLFNRVTGVGHYNESFFKYLAFEKRDELESYLELKENQESTDEFLLRSLNSERPEEHWDQYHGNMKQVIIQYEDFDYNQLNMAQILRDLLHKINSIRKMIELLKAGNVEWDESDDAVMALQKFLNEEDED